MKIQIFFSKYLDFEGFIYPYSFVTIRQVSMLNCCTELKCFGINYISVNFTKGQCMVISSLPIVLLFNIYLILYYIATFPIYEVFQRPYCRRTTNI